MRAWKVTVDTPGMAYSDKYELLVRASNAVKAIEKACHVAKRKGSYARYEALSVELVGEIR